MKNNNAVETIKALIVEGVEEFNLIDRNDTEWRDRSMNELVGMLMCLKALADDDEKIYSLSYWNDVLEFGVYERGGAWQKMNKIA